MAHHVELSMGEAMELTHGRRIYNGITVTSDAFQQYFDSTATFPEMVEAWQDLTSIMEQSEQTVWNYRLSTIENMSDTTELIDNNTNTGVQNRLIYLLPYLCGLRDGSEMTIQNIDRPNDISPFEDSERMHDILNEIRYKDVSEELFSEYGSEDIKAWIRERYVSETLHAPGALGPEQPDLH